VTRVAQYIGVNFSP